MEMAGVFSVVTLFIMILATVTFVVPLLKLSWQREWKGRCFSLRSRKH